MLAPTQAVLQAKICLFWWSAQDNGLHVAARVDERHLPQGRDRGRQHLQPGAGRAGRGAGLQDVGHGRAQQGATLQVGEIATTEEKEALMDALPDLRTRLDAQSSTSMTGNELERAVLWSVTQSG